MATRKQIRENFYAELETAASPTVAATSIGQEYPNEAEELPAVVHDDDYREVPMNTNTGPVGTQEDSAGVQAEVYSEIMEARFTLLVVSDDEQEKETVYEDIRGHFGDFKFPVRDAEEIHSDAFRVEVNDSNSEDTESRDPPARGDRLAVNVQFERYFIRGTTPATEVTLNQDADNDGNTDNTYTTI